MPHILLAEDGPTAMVLAGGLLDAPDLTFDVVTDGRSLLDQVNANANQYDAIVLAYDLPEISGSECAGFLRQMYQRLPVLVMVADLTDTHRQELGNKGIRPKHVQNKPIDRTTFANWVQQAVKEAPPRRAPDAGQKN